MFSRIKSLKYVLASSVLVLVMAGFLGSCSWLTSGTGMMDQTCADGCASYKWDGSGCAILRKGVPEECKAYFEDYCKSEPQYCVNK